MFPLAFCRTCECVCQLNVRTRFAITTVSVGVVHRVHVNRVVYATNWSFPPTVTDATSASSVPQ